MKKKILKKSIADGLLTGLVEAVQYDKGKVDLKSYLRVVPGPSPKWSPAKIRFLRKEVFLLSQPLFAALLNVGVATIRSWEQGQKKPSGAALRLLQILELDKNIVKKLVA